MDERNRETLDPLYTMDAPEAAQAVGETLEELGRIEPDRLPAVLDGQYPPAAVLISEALRDASQEDGSHTARDADLLGRGALIGVLALVKRLEGGSNKDWLRQLSAG